MYLYLHVMLFIYFVLSRWTLLKFFIFHVVNNFITDILLDALRNRINENTIRNTSTAHYLITIYRVGASEEISFDTRYKYLVYLQSTRDIQWTIQNQQLEQWAFMISDGNNELQETLRWGEVILWSSF